MWRSNAWAMVNTLGKDVCEIIDDFCPLRPVNDEDRWTSLIIKLAHKPVNVRGIKCYIVNHEGIMKEFQITSSRTNPYIVIIHTLHAQWIRTRYFTRLRFVLNKYRPNRIPDVYLTGEWDNYALSHFGEGN